MNVSLSTARAGWVRALGAPGMDPDSTEVQTNTNHFRLGNLICLR